MSGYSVFAQYYDRLTANVEYRQRAQFFHSLIRRHGGVDGGLLLDLACGTGSLSLELSALGYEVIGADTSEDMLSVAMQKAAQSQQNLLFLRQSMDRLDLYGTVDYTVCALDSLNHLSGEKALDATFAKVSLFTNPGGLFLFDVNTAYKHQQILGDNCFVYDLDGLFCVWQNSYHQEHHRVDITLDFFAQTEGGLFCRTTERFYERIFDGETLEKSLARNGFSLLNIYADDSLDPPAQTTQRLIYVAQKASN